MRLFVALVIFLLASATSHAGTLEASDDFNDNFKDPELWLPDFVSGGALLTEANQHLEYIAADAPGEESLSSREWIGSTLRFDATWVVEMNVWNGAGVEGFQLASIGIQIGLRATSLATLRLKSHLHPNPPPVWTSTPGKVPRRVRGAMRTVQRRSSSF